MAFSIDTSVRLISIVYVLLFFVVVVVCERSVCSIFPSVSFAVFLPLSRIIRNLYSCKRQLETAHTLAQARAHTK